ncbi:MAG: glycosyltransferase family 2 protein [Armatimonadota bacterium]|nr:glycosyltransferase family 2 protein [bacterium]
MQRISVVIHVCDEEQYIDECLNSIAWADEIVIIDMGSTDSTVAMCHDRGAQIFTHPRVPVVELARNFGISKATGDWILVLDPDERVADMSGKELSEIANDPASCDGYYVSRVNWIFGKRINHSGWGDDRLLRFFRNRKCTWPSSVHSVPVVNGTVGTIEPKHCYLIHDNYRTLEQFVEKMNRYTSQEAQRLYDAGRPFHWLKLFYQPMKEFNSRYIKHKGYRDGFIGFVLAVLMAFYIQLSYLKLWEKYDNKDK